MRQPMVRYTDWKAQDEAKLARILLETGASVPVQPPHLRHALTKPGDPRQLRGIPVQARGVGGTAPGTDPYRALR